MAETTTVPDQRFKAILRHARISPQKVRYVATVIRGQNVNRALEILQATTRRAARFLHKLLKSAIANAESITSDRNLDIDVEELRIETLMVDGGVSLKRWRTAPQGRAVPILKRTSHITLVLGPSPDAPVKEKRKPSTKKQDKGKGKEKVATDSKPHQDHPHEHGAHDHSHDHPHAHGKTDHSHDRGHAHDHGHKPDPDKKKG